MESREPVLVDFWATWCVPCRALGPVIDELAGEYDGRMKIAKINIDENPKTPTRYGIMSIPTLMFFKDGRAASQVTGAIGKAELKKKIAENLI